MGMFVEFGQRMNKVALDAFSAYIDAREKLAIAEREYNKESNPYLDPTGKNYEQQAYAARAKANMLEAQNKLRQEQANLRNGIDSLMAIRKELQAAISEKLCASGDQVDIGTLELLKSGIMKPQEYFTLFNRASESHNHTMMRLIGKYAGEVAPKAPTKELEAQMRVLASNARRAASGDEYLQSCDSFINAYQRTANNPNMLKSWNDIANQILAGF